MIFNEPEFSVPSQKVPSERHAICHMAFSPLTTLPHPASFSLSPFLPSFILLLFFLPASFSPSLKTPSEKLNSGKQNVPPEPWPRRALLPQAPHVSFPHGDQQRAQRAHVCCECRGDPQRKPAGDRVGACVLLQPPSPPWSRESLLPPA